MYKQEYERDRCEKSVHRCYSLVDNTSERHTKWKKMQINTLNNLKYSFTVECFFHVVEGVLCLKLGEIFGLVCLAPVPEKNRRLESYTLN